jgi:hypothetical protein
MNINFCDFISVLEFQKIEDLVLKHTKPITSYRGVKHGMYFTVLTSTKYRMFYYIIITLSCFDLRMIHVKESSH